MTFQSVVNKGGWDLGYGGAKTLGEHWGLVPKWAFSTKLVLLLVAQEPLF